MLHKTENMIMADCLLRMIRLEKSLKHIEGLVMPYLNGDEQGYSIKIKSINIEHIYVFVIDVSGNISVQIDDYTLSSLDNTFSSDRTFIIDHIINAKDYIVAAIVSTLKNNNQNISLHSKYNAL